VDFPPPTKKVPLLRRLRTRCGSRGRAVPLTGPGAISSGRLKAARHQTAVEMPPVPEASCPLLPGLRAAPGRGGVRQDGPPVPFSPLLAGLKYTDEEASPQSAGRRGRAGAAKAKEVFSECSTEAPSPYSSFVSTASSGMSDVSDMPPSMAALCAAEGSSRSLGEPWFESILSEGLLPAPPPRAAPQDCHQQLPPAAGLRSGSLVEVVGTYPSGEQAIVIGFDPVGDSYQVQLMRNGHLTHRLRSIKCRNVRLLRNP